MKNTLTKDGKIRANRTCPFLKRCGMKTANCPQRGNTRPHQFSCGAARLFNIASERPKVEPKVEEVKPVELWNINEAVETKRAERFGATTWIPQHELASYPS